MPRHALFLALALVACTPTPVTVTPAPRLPERPSTQPSPPDKPAPPDGTRPLAPTASALWVQGEALVVLAASSAQEKGGPREAILVSQDRGASWKSATLTEAASISLRPGRLLDVWGDGAGLVLAAGEGGRLLRSTDGGQTFTGIRTKTRAPLLRVWGDGQGALFAVGGEDCATTPGGQGVILRSLDQGTTWEDTTVDAKLHAIHGAGGTLYAVGAHATVMRSTNQGKTWERVLGASLDRTGAHCTPKGDAPRFRGKGTAEYALEAYRAKEPLQFTGTPDLSRDLSQSAGYAFVDVRVPDEKGAPTLWLADEAGNFYSGAAPSSLALVSFDQNLSGGDAALASAGADLYLAANRTVLRRRGAAWHALWLSPHSFVEDLAASDGALYLLVQQSDWQVNLRALGHPPQGDAPTMTKTGVELRAKLLVSGDGGVTWRDLLGP